MRWAAPEGCGQALDCRGLSVMFLQAHNLLEQKLPKVCTSCRGEFLVGSPQGYDTATSSLSHDEGSDAALSDNASTSPGALQLAAGAMDSAQRSLAGAQDTPSSGPGTASSWGAGQASLSQAPPAGVHQAAAGGRDSLALAARQRRSSRAAAQAAGAEQAGPTSRRVTEQEAEPSAGHAHLNGRPAGVGSAGKTAEPSAEQLRNDQAEEAGNQSSPKLCVHTSSQSATQAGSRPVQIAPMRRSSSHHDRLAQQDAAVVRASPGTDAALRPDKSSTGGVEQAGGKGRPMLCHRRVECL